MEDRYINRYNTFCRSLDNLAKSQHADASADFVPEGTVQNFNLTFDISWKVMKDLLVKKFGIVDFAVGSPRETLQRAFTVGLIDDDGWLRMLKIRNQLAHDYDGSLAMEEFWEINHGFYPLFVKFRERVKDYCTEGTQEERFRRE